MKNNKTVTIVALIVAVASLTIGFAAFSSTLTISSSATVTPNADTFKVGFSTARNSLTSGTIAPNIVPASDDVVKPTATNATITETTISGINVGFTEPGSYVSYSAYIYNAGEYDAYLNDVILENVSGKTVNKECVAGEGATQALVEAACNDITLGWMMFGYNTSHKKESDTNISDFYIGKGGFSPVSIQIDYPKDSARADGPFTVRFGDITINLSSAD